jgi:hypothetical protein
MHRKVIMVAVVGLLAALLASAASADQPTIQQFPYEDHFVTESCGFPVQVDGVGKVVDISYTDAQGNFHDFQAGPTVKSTLTNLVTGKTIVVNNSGPADFTFAADGITLVGTGGWIWGRLDPATFTPGIFLTQGRFVLTRSASGAFRSYTLTGTTIGLCARLA